MNYFHTYISEEILPLIKTRQYETKIGEKIIISSSYENNAKFVLMGIKDDVGVILNGGVPGTSSTWEIFLSSFLNIQHSSILNGNHIQLEGYFDFTSFNPLKTNDELQEAISIIDEEVYQKIYTIVKQNKIPLVIGGGHNNSYPLIKGAATGLFETKQRKNPSINCINLDAHSDFRIQEGRHSGNGFRYAYDEHYLKKYSIVGLHENYLQENIYNELNENTDIHFSTWENIFLRENISYKKAIQKAIGFAQSKKEKRKFIGIELDMDCIENILSSATTPSGLSTTQARYYIHEVAKKTNACYLHIAEGAHTITTQSQPTIGKLISYLVSDFIKGLR